MYVGELVERIDKFFFPQPPCVLDPKVIKTEESRTESKKDLPREHRGPKVAGLCELFEQQEQENVKLVPQQGSTTRFARNSFCAITRNSGTVYTYT